MLSTSRLNAWFALRPNNPRRAWRQFPSIGQVETLEDRCLLAAFFVTTLNDSGAGSLRQAVIDANSNNNPNEIDAIRFVPALLNTSRVIALTSGQLQITQSVSILGPSFDATGIIVSGNNNSRVFQVTNTAQTVLFQYFTITQGNSGGGNGGGLLNSGPNTFLTDMVVSGNQGNFGGGVSAATGRLEIQRSRIISNTAGNDGGGVDISDGTLIINDTTIDSNVADDGGGVSIQSGADTTVIGSSTLSHNTASSGSGGGIFSASTTSTALSVQNATIVGNISTSGGGGIMASAGTVNVVNLTIANNTDFSSDAATAAGGVSRIGGGTVMGVNLVVSQNFSNSGNSNINGASSVVFNGSTGQQLASDMIGGNPQLGPLQDNGGPTFTMMPLAGSPVLGAGITAGTTQLDQRGFSRSVSAGGNGAPSVDQGAVEFFPTLTQPYVVGPGNNNGTQGSRSYSSTDNPRSPRFENQGPVANLEVRVALADINGDGTKDIITAPGLGGEARIIVRNGIDPSVILRNFIAYDNFLGGVYVASGDINNDGVPDIITGSGQGSNHIRVFSGADNSLLLNLFPFGGFTGGVRVASGDINGDGRADIIVAAGPGGGPHVKVYSGSAVLGNPNDSSLIAGPLGSFFAYGNFGGGVYVASGDMNNDGLDDLITGAGEGGGPHVLVFTNTSTGPIISFFAYGANFFGGVRVGVVDRDGDKFEDIVTGAGPGGGPHVRIISGRILTNFSTPTDLVSYFAFDANFSGGVFVGGSDGKIGGGSPLFLDDAFLPPEDAAAGISADDLANTTLAAIDRFESAGLNAFDLARLQNATVELAHLNGNLLGFTLGNRVFIDANAAGFGFFVDATPGDDIEFQTATGQALAAQAIGRVDLLTVVIHELAHVLGLPDLDSDLYPDHVLADQLAPGIRRVVGEEDLAGLDLVFQSEDLADALN